MTTARHPGQLEVTADPDVPMIRFTRDFAATPEQLHRAHTDPDVFKRWIGPSERSCEIDYWDCRTGGSWRFLNPLCGGDSDQVEAFHGSFHDVRADRIVQTFTWEGYPDGVSLETLTFEGLGHGMTRLHGSSLLASFSERDMMVSSGMEGGMSEGYAKLDALLAAADEKG